MEHTGRSRMEFPIRIMERRRGMTAFALLPRRGWTLVGTIFRAEDQHDCQWVKPGEFVGFGLGLAGSHTMVSGSDPVITAMQLADAAALGQIAAEGDDFVAGISIALAAVAA